MLDRHAARLKGNDGEAPAPEAYRANGEMQAAAEAMPSPSALESLCGSFGLSTFERDLLLLAAGPELDARFSHSCELAGALPPNFGLGLAALADPHWSALAPTSALRRWHLLSVGNGDSLTGSPLRIEEPVLHYLAGIPCIDERLLSMTEPVAPTNAGLPPSQERIVRRIHAVWNATAAGGRLPAIRLHGSDRRAPYGIAADVCAHTGMSLRAIPARSIPMAPADLDLFCRLFERDAVMHSLALLIDCTDLGLDEQGRIDVIVRALDEIHTPLFVVGRVPMAPRRRALSTFDVAKPSSAEQRELWAAASGPLDLNGEVERLTTQFDLSAETIRSVAAEALLDYETWGQSEERSVGELFWKACRTTRRNELDELAQRIEARSAWDDLILPERQKRMLAEMVLQARNRSTVYEGWGFGRQGERGLGISALFAGPSGTGKTMAAEIIADELGLDLYRIDLSSVISKYIGETEKNLKKVFDAADEGGAVLLFDEADSIFGKRTEVKDSHDRHANVEVSYLLQRMEAYRGIAVLTTNMKSALDSAFLRRIRFVVTFPFPDAEHREQIWRRVFPKSAPVERVDPARLAQLNVTGGHIRNIALAGAFLAADAGEPIRMEHLLAAAKSEMIKLEKSLTAAETRGWI